MPKIVLYHRGSSDITQSKLAKVNVTPKITRKAAERRTFTRVHRGSPSRSCFCEHRRIATANVVQRIAKTAARARKNGRESQNRLKARAVSAGDPRLLASIHEYSSGRATKTTARRTIP